MQEYKAYIVDKGGHITERIDLICEDEDVARGRAKQLVDGHAVELWQGNRKIDRFDPPPGGPPA
ncbi:hypothetical protein EOW77_0003535 [Bradyrhizobium yuanmingense]|uniref:hypothetical protein n=1 Tax=Bradyrhizobium yuanmingense TaxID=108015 RepID=UPI000FE3D540|nr:hypothetical protein [Bradyrhizobium yuanmingense]TGN90918.1 hypothetical protein EOW77_0003535 [Bradyrhizobium yuanmingense]